MKQMLKDEWKQLVLYWAFTSIGSYIVSTNEQLGFGLLECAMITALSIAGAILLAWIISFFINLFN